MFMRFKFLSALSFFEFFFLCFFFCTNFLFFSYSDMFPIALQFVTMIRNYLEQEAFALLRAAYRAEMRRLANYQHHGRTRSSLNSTPLHLTVFTFDPLVAHIRLKKSDSVSLRVCRLSLRTHNARAANLGGVWKIWISKDTGLDRVVVVIAYIRQLIFCANNKRPCRGNADQSFAFKCTPPRPSLRFGGSGLNVWKVLERVRQDLCWRKK